MTPNQIVTVISDRYGCRGRTGIVVRDFGGGIVEVLISGSHSTWTFPVTELV